MMTLRGASTIFVKCLHKPSPKGRCLLQHKLVARYSYGQRRPHSSICQPKPYSLQALERKCQPSPALHHNVYHNAKPENYTVFSV